MTIKWHLEEKPLKSLKKYAKNPRQLTKEQYYHLRQSIEKYGLASPLLVNQDNMIIGGHQRARILKELGHTSVECYVPDRQLDEKEVEELCIRLNKNGGAFDFDTLANEFEADDLLAWGFNETELIGAFTEIDEETTAEPKKKSKKKECPSCGFEF
jgi:ParB-like chromosome segregation protein Spo0J